MFARFLFARFLVVFLTTLLVVRVPGTAYGLDYYWDANGNIPPDGVFNVPFNWNPNMVPDPWDVAIFNLSDIYIVTFDNSPIVDYFQVLNNGEVWFTGQSGTETFTMDGLTGEVLIDQGGVLVVSDLHVSMLDNQLVIGDTPGPGNEGELIVGGSNTTWFAPTDLAVGRFGTGSLGVMNGADLSTGVDGYIGQEAGSYGDVMVDGAGSIWDIAGTLRVGDSGDGILNVSNGGTVTSGNLRMADDLVTGDVMVNGPGSSLSVAGATISNNGVAMLDVTGGGLFESSLGAVIASGVGSTGVVFVVDPDSKMTIADSLSIGGAAAGTGARTAEVTVELDATLKVGDTINVWNSGAILTLDGNGWINTGSLNVESGGVFNHNDGLLTIDGGTFNPGAADYEIDGWQPVVEMLNGSTAALSGDLTVGNNGSGTLLIAGGSDVTNTMGYIGYGTGTGIVAVDEAGSTWNNSGSLLVGWNGNGTLDVSNGGRVTSYSGNIGCGTGSQGTVVVDGANSTWDNTGGLYVGQSGIGWLDIYNGGSVTSYLSAIGSGTGEGTVTVDGTNSTWYSGVELYVGQSGTGTLAITDGGYVDNTDGYVGFAGGSQGTVTVDGAGSMWYNQGLLIGESGTGTLDISGGGSVTSGIGFIAFSPGSQGTVTVDGANSMWYNAYDLIVGYSSIGSVAITDGGVVENSTGSVGNGLGSQGSVTVDGADSTWHNRSTLHIGLNGTGTLLITSGGSVDNGNGNIGYNNGSVGTVTVDGTDSTWNNRVNLFVGRDGTGTLEITGGGRVANDIGYIGYETGQGDVTVGGSNSRWNNSEELYVGRNGPGTLDITNGGSVTNTLGYIGYGTGQGTVTVEGIDSTWDNSSDLQVGVDDIGTLDISGGGSVTSVAGYIGYGTGEGTVTVDGTGSAWNGSGDLSIGQSGTGILDITGGGSVTNAVGFIGHGAGSQGTVTVAGSGSTWDNGWLYVGGSATAAGGTGVLTVQSGGTVDAGTILRVWSTGTVHLNGGTIKAGTFDLEGGTFNFNYGTLHDTSDLAVEIGDDLADILGGSHTVGFGKHLKVSQITTLNDILTIDDGTFSTGSLVNPGLLQFTRGTFNLTGDDLTIGSGGLFGNTLLLTGDKTVGVTNNTTITATGMLELQYGNFSTGTLNNHGVLKGSGTTTVIGAATNESGGLIELQYGNLSAAGLTNHGEIRGRGTVSASLDNSAGGVVRAAAADYLVFDGASHQNSGLVSIIGGTVEFTGAVTNEIAGIFNGRGGLVFNDGLTNHGTMDFGGGTDIYGDVVNGQTGSIGSDGEIVVSAGASVAFHGDVIHNGIEFKVSPGADVAFFGAVSGAGSFTGGGGVWFEGDYSPGNSPAWVPLAVDVNYGDESTATMELSSYEAIGPGDTQYDVVEMVDDNTLTLDGTLEIVLQDGFEPDLGYTFDIFRHASGARTGQFDEEIQPTWYLDCYFDVIYGDEAVTLRAMPGPSVIPGDFNLDGVVDVSDLGILATNYGKSGMKWGEGDATGEGDVDVSDLGVLATNYGNTASTATMAVPEPATLGMLLILGGLAMLRRRRR